MGMPTRDPAKQKVYSRRYYERHKADYLARNAIKRKRIAEWFAEYKSQNPCVDCKTLYPAYVMDFDHLPGTVKLHHPNQLVNRLSWRALRDELDKCELVCANCHRIRTHARRVAAKAEPCQTSTHGAVRDNPEISCPTDND